MSENIWFSSDLHVDHKNIVKYSNRPWTFEEQEAQIVERWNSRVGLLDKAYHLGDFMFVGAKGRGPEKVKNVLKQLNGEITFIMGNHDNPRLWDILKNDPELGFIDVCHYKEIKIDSQPIVLCHYPFEVWNGSHHGSWHLHGHCHGSLPAVGKRLDVGLDNHPDFQVFSFEEVKLHMDGQSIVIKDHHDGSR